MAEHPVDLSTRLIDGGIADVPPNRLTNELSELGDGLAIIESFSHVIVVDTGDGLIGFDSSGPGSGAAVVESLRRWSDDRVHSLVYTHGHIDHVGGSRSFAADAEARGEALPRVVGHANLAHRLDRYEATNGYNLVINNRQFGGSPVSALESRDGVNRSFVPHGTLRPGVEYQNVLTEAVGGVELEYHHALGETDDHTWTWLPQQKMISAGDQFIWRFPNCGNPQKVQRYPLEWAQSLREMAAKPVELFVPAHGLPIVGNERILRCLDTVASTLEWLVGEVVAAMNSGATLDDIVHSVHVDPGLLELPYLVPLYDEPEFVVRNIWRLYGGWWDADPAHLKPASAASLGAEIAALAGGSEVLAARARELVDSGDFRLACHLIEFATNADPTSEAVHEARSDIYLARRQRELSLMSKGIFGSAAAESMEARGIEVERRRQRISLGE